MSVRDKPVEPADESPGAGTPDLLAAALAWHNAGFCVIPIKAWTGRADDEGKKPALSSWRPYMTHGPTRELVTGWFSGQSNSAAAIAGIALVCGGSSGGLEMAELEGRAVDAGKLAELRELAEASGLGDLVRRLTFDGYVERSPSGGFHWLYRISDAPVPGPGRLARNANGELLAETKGQGGYVVVAPSAGVHPTGRPYVAVQSTPATVPTITKAERDAFMGLLRALDETPSLPDPAPFRPAPSRPPAPGEVRPGDDFEARTDWADILGPHGWTLVFKRRQVRYWRRPGKQAGVSATTGRAADRDRLYVFTTSTEFDVEAPYTKFGAYALLNYGGNHAEAAKELAARGYGRRASLSPNAMRDRSAFTVLAQPAPDAASAAEASVEVVDEPVPEASAFGPSEDGLARALIAHHSNELRYCPQRGTWLVWAQHRWRWDDAEQHRELVRALARSLPEVGDWRRFKQRALSAAGVSGTVRQAQSDPAIVADIGQLDADPWALNTPAGVVDLRTGKLGPADPAGLHTRSTTCAPCVDADPSRWLEFLADTFGADAAGTELVCYLQRLVGYSAVGAVGPHVLPFCHGSGGNGKGVFLEALAAVLGDYATTAPVGFLMARTIPGHETEIARLAGARMVICSEVNEDDRFDEARVKQLTGGDTLTARYMRADHFSFTPSHHLWLMGNHKPAVRSGGRSFWRRLRLVPFEHEVPEADIVEDLQGILARDHGPALLAWIAAGAAEYHERGLAEPDSVKAATAAYARDQDTVARFVEECCHVGGGRNVKFNVGKVRDAYEAWCAAEGETPVSAKALTQTLTKRFGVGRYTDGRTRFYTGLALAVSLADSDDQRSQKGLNLAAHVSANASAAA